MKQILYIIMACLLTGLSSCNKETHNNERGLVVELSNPNKDAVTDLRVWLYNQDGQQVDELHYTSYAEVSKSLLDYPAGEYTVVVATNIVEPFRIDKLTTGASDLENLFVRLSSSTSPLHSHYGVQRVTVQPTGITRVAITLNRTLAELSLTFKNVPSEVLSATVVVTNCADGFYPGISKLSANMTAVTIGKKIAPKNGTLTFPMVKLMPVIAPTTRADELKTVIALTFHYSNGGIMTFNIETPALQNGGTYTPEVEYAVLRPGMVIEINDINGWVKLPSITGEILNPKNN